MVHQMSLPKVHQPWPAEIGDPSRGAEYRPGVCNIGPEEIERRRLAGHVGVLATIGLYASLILLDAPQPARMIVALPATIAASGYLQARLRFCAGFGSRGVFNLGPLGPTERVDDPAARARDRAIASRIGLASFLIGALVGLVAALLPV